MEGLTSNSRSYVDIAEPYAGCYIGLRHSGETHRKEEKMVFKEDVPGG
jgi:hypothetical protein